MERLTKFVPAYDKRHPTDPKKDYGIGDVRCMMVLKGELGAVHFIFGTGMFLPETMQEYARDGRLAPTKYSHSDDYFILNKPMGHDVGYHSPKPLHDGQEVHHPTKMRKKNPDLPDPGMDATPEERTAYFDNIKFDKIGKNPPKCEWLGVPCYCDGSAMRGDEWMGILLREGSDKIWELLEGEYKATFGELR